MDNIIEFITDYGVFALRVAASLLTVFTIVKCFYSMRIQKRGKKPLISLHNTITDETVPVYYWENSLGRSRGSDIYIADSTVSRDHAVLLRRNEGWFISDTGSKAGVFVNNKRCQGRTQIFLNDVITLGATQFEVKKGESSHRSLDEKDASPHKKAMRPFVLLLLMLFSLFMFFTQAAFASDGFMPEAFIVYGAFSAVVISVFAFTRGFLKRSSFELETLGLLFSGIGVSLLIRQNLRQAYVQLICVILGVILFLVIIRLLEHPDKLLKMRMYAMGAAVVLLAINLVFGTVRSGAQNWIQIGSITVQPSELVKVIFIFVSAATLDVLQTNRNLTEFIIFSAICIGALFIMSDFGTALIFFATFLIISIIRSGDYKTVILALVAAFFGAMIILCFKPYIAQRFAAWGNVWQNYDDAAYQQARVLTYSASGGLFGVGVGNGFLKYIFASESDLVFGLLCEESGLIVAVTVALSLAALVFYTREITTLSRSSFYSISACCAAGLLIIQASLNVFGATDILPLTGVTLPFISLGGSSMISCWGLLAFIKAADERTYKKLSRKHSAQIAES